MRATALAAATRHQHVVRHPDARAAEHVERAEGHLIVRADERGRRAGREKLLGGLAPGRPGEVAAPHRHVVE